MLAIKISKIILPKSFCIISDDCWGGQLYRQLKIPYLTPTVGLWIEPEDYLRYVEEFHKIHQEDLIFIETDKKYPVATLSGIKIHFMHYQNQHEARSKYWKRYHRIKNCKIFIKIDFGKSGYSNESIEKWNALSLENSLALYPKTMAIPTLEIFNGVAIPDWQLDGARMFDISRKHFNLFAWIRHGTVSNSILYKSLNIFLFDPTAPRRIANKVRHQTR